MKLCIYRAILDDIKKADRVTHRTVARCLWKIHKICCVSTFTCYNFTTLPTLPGKRKQMPYRFAPKLKKPKITNIEIANHLCRIRKNFIIA
jgi:hypothetical protein